MLYLMQLELRASEWNQVCWCVLNFDIAVFQFFAFLSKSLVSMPNKSYPRIEAHVFLYRMVLSKVEFGGPHAWNNSRKCMRAEITWCRMGHGDWKMENWQCEIQVYISSHTNKKRRTLVWRISSKILHELGYIERYLWLKFYFDPYCLRQDIAKTKGSDFWPFRQKQTIFSFDQISATPLPISILKISKKF